MRSLVIWAMLAASASATHPIAGVVSLLQDLQIQAKEEGAAEASLFQKFTYWCKTTTKDLDKNIRKEKKAISELTDKIDGLTTDIGVLAEEISKLGTEIAAMESAAAKAKKMRDDEVDLYKSEQDNFGGTIDAVDIAIDTMEDSEALLQSPGKKQKVRQAAALLTPAKRAEVESLLQVDAAPAAPEAKAYQFKSGNIIETFKGMNTEFEGEKLDSEQAETNKQNAYNLAKQARDTAIKAAQDSKEEKEGIKGDKGSSKSSADSDRSSEKNDLVADSTSLDNTEKECVTKTAEWNDRSATREGELKALEMAQKILSKVTDVRNPDSHHIPQKSLIENSQNVEEDSSRLQRITGIISFLQVDDPRTKAVNLLKQAATSGHSKALQDLAEQLRTYEGPFDKVNGMIQKMIFRLMSEQKDEDDHKNWCDMETEKNTESKDDKSDKMRDMKAAITQLDSEIKILINEISNNNERVATLISEKKQETELRNENHEEIVATIKDSQDAQAAVAQATAVLKDFYKNSGMTPKEPWEFVQTGSSPDTWDSSYSGTSDPNSSDGVLTLLDGVMQKFSKMEADSKAADETDQKNFENDMAANKVEVATKGTDTEMKTSKKDSLQQKMENTAAMLKSTTAEHDAVHQYLKDLEPACGTGDSSYGDRKQARSDEITALRKAQGILTEAFRAKGFLQK